MELIINNITKSFENLIFKDMSLSINRNGLYAITGESGCGKSTLFNMILRKDNIYEGSILINNYNIRDNSTKLNDLYFNQIGFVSQNPTCIASLKVRDYFLMLLDKNIKDTRRYNELLSNLKIDNLEEHYCYELSAGQKQRVAICKALLEDKPLLFLDEPTSSQDNVSSDIIFEVLKKESATKIILIASHDYERSNLYCDEIFKISDFSIDTVSNKFTDCNNTNDSISLVKKNNKIIRKLSNHSGAKGYLLNNVIYCFLCFLGLLFGNFGIINYNYSSRIIINKINDYVKIALPGSTSENYIVRGENLINKLDTVDDNYFKCYENNEFGDISILSFSSNYFIDERLLAGNMPVASKEYIVSDEFFRLVTGSDDLNFSMMNSYYTEFSCVGIYQKEKDTDYIYMFDYNYIEDYIPCYWNNILYNGGVLVSNFYTDPLVYGTNPVNDNEIIISSKLAFYLNLGDFNEIINKNILFGDGDKNNEMEHKYISLNYYINKQMKIVGIIENDSPLIVLPNEKYHNLYENYKKFYQFDYILGHHLESSDFVYYNNNSIELSDLNWFNNNILRFRVIFIIVSCIFYVLFISLVFRKQKHFQENLKFDINELNSMGISMNTILIYQIIFCITNLLFVYSILSIFTSLILKGMNYFIGSLFNIQISCIKMDFLFSILYIIIAVISEFIYSYLYFKRRKIDELD